MVKWIQHGRARVKSGCVLVGGWARFAIVLLLFPVACASQKSAPVEIRWYRAGRDLAADALPGALYVPEYRAGVAAIKDSATWAAVWRMAMNNHRPLPHVDFARVTLVTISYGSQSGCGANTRHLVRVVAGAADTVWVEARRDPRRTDTSCDMVFTEADLAVIERPRANIRWRAARTEQGAQSRPIPSDSLWRKLTRPER